NLRLQQVYEALYQTSIDIAFEGTPIGTVRRWFERHILGEIRLTEDESAPKRVAALLQQLGPTYVKIGQMLAARSDLLPADWTTEFARLQADASPFPWLDARQVIKAELGKTPEEAYASIEEEPFAAASTAQVHRATLADGTLVAVKIQRPQIVAKTKADLGVMQELAKTAEQRFAIARRVGIRKVVGEFESGVLEELDYRNEAYHARRLADSMSKFEQIHIPVVYEELSSSRVLTMEFVHGIKIADPEPLRDAGLDPSQLGATFMRAIIKQVLIDGFFHADPHPGNVFLTDDGRVALLDLGMVGRLSPELQERLIRLVMAISEGNGPDAAQVTIDMGEAKEEFDRAGFVKATSDLVGQFHGAAAARNLQVGRILLEVFRAAADTGVRLPVEMAMLGRALLALDQVGRTLDPDFDPNASIRRNVSDILRRRMLRSLSPGRAFANLLEVNELVQKLPARINRMLDRAEERGVTLRVNLDEEIWITEGFQKVANRLTTGLISAALIVGAAMMMRVQTRFTILGYPGLAMIFFVLAAVLGVWLVADIIRQDRHRKPPPAAP
ncbi:MAG TPA: AarF/UbiB family protein, partial [Longimicrobiaceae bacterium]|nr:AarF/UbiB family protein [Longimicrobiaceae bacterium]